ncbi:MAG: hypothetical protein KC656_09595, partial [Myxococcales bacterium]|nr:hypothetical protein [Myxococcales bacterium]
ASAKAFGTRARLIERLPFVGAVVAAAGAGLLAYSAERAAALETAPDAATLERRWAAHKATRASGAGVVVVGLGVLLVGAF